MDAQRESPVVHGAASHTDPAVVAIVGRRLYCGTPPQAICTGTLIAPRVVLTAAHCFKDFRVSDVRVFFGDDVGATGTTIDVDTLQIDPRYDASTGRYDAAVVRLTQAASVTPIPLRTVPLDASLAGKSLRVVGFGVDEAGASGVKKAGTAKFDSFDASASEVFRYVPGPAMTCSGDSGGPVLYDDGTGVALIGSTRSGDAACASYGNAVRIDALTASLLNPFIASVDAAPTRPAFDLTRDDCTKTCSSDADCPLAMTCLNERSAGMHCGFPGLQSGHIAGSCHTDADCGGNTCVALGDNTCGCFTACSPPATAAPHGGCAMVRFRNSNGRAPSMILVAALTCCLAMRRERSRGVRLSMRRV